MKQPLACAVLASAIALALAAAGPLAAAPQQAAKEAPMQAQTAPTTNPFFADSTLPLRYPDFARIKDGDFAPAFDRGMAEELKEVQAIADNPAAPTFDNTILALEKSGRILYRAGSVFFNLLGADKNEAREKLDEEYSPKFAAHRDAIRLNPKLFARIKSLYDRRAQLGLDAEGTRLVERYYTDFVRAGANLDEAQKARLKEINGELAKLSTQFDQKVLAERNASAVVVDTREELDGLSDEQIDAAAATAKQRGLEGKYVLTILNTTGQPPAAALTNRAVREKLYRASLSRNSRGNENDTTAIVSQVVRLRAERAKLLGYPTHAAYVLEDETAKTPQAVNQMLARLAPPAVANARREAAELQAMIDKEQAAKGEPSFKLEPWDWSFYSEKVRKAKYAFDENQLKPYLELDNVLQKGVFHAANQLYGLTFKERKDLPVYHPDVRVFDVIDRDGQQLAIFLFDPFARDSKRGGAWMNSYVDQSEVFGTRPVVANHLNITKAPEGKPTLLTWDEVTTTFHEFGHALHGMFSNVKYPYFTGTSVPRDFVEYPSQVNEMWADWPSVLANYARHYQTGEPMPKALLDKVIAASKFNQGFATTEYLGASLIDQELHQVGTDKVPAPSEVMAFEAAALRKHGVDFAPVPPRYRTPYFSHIMGGYSAGYYAYIWSEVLDAASVDWLKSHGGLTRENGDHFRATLLSRGGSKDALQLFRDFAGRDPDITPLLKRRGLDAPVSDDSKVPGADAEKAPAPAGGS
jgi:peptidyl-dipeptidase Dcp